MIDDGLGVEAQYEGALVGFDSQPALAFEGADRLASRYAADTDGLGDLVEHTNKSCPLTDLFTHFHLFFGRQRTTVFFRDSKMLFPRVLLLREAQNVISVLFPYCKAKG